jgi:hypothetical protein
MALGALPEKWTPFVRINYAYGDGLATVDHSSRSTWATTAVQEFVNRGVPHPSRPMMATLSTEIVEYPDSRKF